MKYLNKLIILIITITIFSCNAIPTPKTPRFTSISKDFVLLNKKNTPKHDTMCIIPGTNNLWNYYFVDELSKDLTIKTLFDVKTLKYVGKKLELSEKTPDIIQYPLSDGNTVYSLTEQDHKNIAEAQKKLGAKYIFILWIRYLEGTKDRGLITLRLNAVGKLVEFPQNKVIGYSQKEYNNTTVFNSEDAAIEKIIKKSANSISNEFVKSTKSSK